jgi:DNA primase
LLADEKTKILKDIFGSYYQTGDEALFYCPKCNHHKAKMSVNIGKNAFKCWVCDFSGTNIYRLIRKYGNYNQKSKWKDLSGVVELDKFEQIIHSMLDNEEEITHERVSLPEEFLSLTGKNLSRSATRAKKYLMSRGLTNEDILFWKIGYCTSGPYANRVVIPSFDFDGYVNYFIARSFTDSWKKYMNPKVPKTNMIFNHLCLDFDNDLIITEGIFDAMKAGKNSVPILGSSLQEGSLLFQEIVKNDTPVYMALDKDAEKKALKLINKLLKYGIELYKIDLSPFNDVAEMSRQEFLERKKKATFLNSENYIFYKLLESF